MARDELTIKQMVEKAIKLRNMISAIEADAAERSKPLVDALNKIRAELLTYMHNNDIQSVKTDAGTAYCSLRKKAVLQDKVAFLEWTQRVGAPELVDISVNASAAWDYATEHHETPAGVALSAVPTVNFRSS